MAAELIGIFFAVSATVLLGMFSVMAAFYAIYRVFGGRKSAKEYLSDDNFEKIADRMMGRKK